MCILMAVLLKLVKDIINDGFEIKASRLFICCSLSGPQNPWLISTYAKAAKYPFASVIGQEIFQSGIIPSDTDFRIYRDFGKIPGER